MSKTCVLNNERAELEGMKTYLRFMVTFITMLSLVLLAFFAKPAFVFALAAIVVVGWPLMVTSLVRLYDKEGVESRVAVMGIGNITPLLMLPFGHYILPHDQQLLLVVAGFAVNIWGAFFAKR